MTTTDTARTVPAPELGGAVLSPGLAPDPELLHADGPAPTWTGSAAVISLGDRTRLVLAGEVDASMNDELATCTTEITRLAQPLDVDVRNVTFMDSSVLAVLARLTQRLAGPVRVIRPSESVRFLLDLTHLADLVEILDEDPGTEPDGEREPLFRA